jgi:hypothetical protein
MAMRTRRLVAVLFLVVFPAAALAQERALTCDPERIDRESYRLATEAQALNVTRPRYRWWDAFTIGKHIDDLADLNETTVEFAERAARLDDANLMAHGILARHYVVLGADARYADEAWRRVLDAGGAIVWTATLYDVDARGYFLMAFDRYGLRIYRFGQLAGPTPTNFGIPEFPGPEAVALWRAWGGCLDPAVAPVAVVPWADVREIKAGNWVLWFKLTRPIEVTSDRGKRRTLREIKVCLHGQTGDIEMYPSWDGARFTGWRGIGIGPADYQERVRRTLVKHVDPEGRIALPKHSRGAGW